MKAPMVTRASFQKDVQAAIEGMAYMVRRCFLKQKNSFVSDVMVMIRK
jgi:hypothetical protein